MPRIADYLRQHATERPDTLAIINGDERISYARLWLLVEAEAQRMQTVEGLRPGDVSLLPASQSAGYLVRFLAIHLVGAICVPVDGTVSLPEYRNPAISDVLFTTGSTSQPKAVLLSHDAIMADADNLIHAHGYRPGLTFVVCGPLHHFGSWSKVLPTLVVGATLHVLDGLKDTEALLSALGSTPCTATFLVPSAIRMLMQLCGSRLMQLQHNIDFIETGAAPIATSDMEQLRQLLPYTRLYNTYASTETGVVCTYPFHLASAERQPSVSDRPVTETEPCRQSCVGPTMRHARIWLDDEGHICVSGPMIMSGYMHDPQPLQEIQTSDIGQIDEHGYLYITGRDSDFINVGGLKVAPAEVEDAASGMEGIKDCICIARPHPMMGQIPCLLVVMQPGCAFDKKAIIRYLKPRLETFKIPLQYEEVGEIKKTFNGKKDRKAYR